MRFRITAALAAAAIAAVLPACAASAHSDQSKAAAAMTTIKVGTGPVEDFGQYYVALKEGYFTKNHLKVQGAEVANGPAGISAIKSGSLDFTYSSVQPLFLADQSGLNLRFVGPGDTETPGHWQYYLTVKAGSSATTIRSALKAGTKLAWIGSSTHNAIALRLWMRKYNMSTTSISYVTASPPDILTALTSGEVQVAIPLQPFITIGLQAKTVKTVGQPLDSILGKNVPTGGFITSASYAKAHSTVVSEFDKALAEATTFIDKNPKKSNQIIGAALKLPPKVISALPPIEFVPQLSETAVQHEITEANSVGLLSAKLKASSLFAS